VTWIPHVCIIRVLTLFAGHTSRPTDFTWAPGEAENWTVASASEDNVVMVWQPTMRVWAADDVKVDEKELEGDAMEGVEATSSSDKLREGAARISEN
jgi:histone-binding protein RBBP4